MLKLRVWPASNNQPESLGPSGELHTNFKLSAAGDYLALIQADGTTVVTKYGANGADYPQQFTDISYGIGRESSTKIGCLANPTPGGVNGNSFASPLSSPAAEVAIVGLELVAVDIITIVLSFSEKVSGPTAVDLANYQIDGGVTILNVALDVDDQTVTLTTTDLAEDAELTLA